MTIVTSLGYRPTFRERQEYEVLFALEDAIKSGDSIDTHDLAVRIVGAIENIDPADFEDEFAA